MKILGSTAATVTAALALAPCATAAPGEARPRLAVVAAVEPFSRGSVAAVLVNVGGAWSLEPRVRFSQETTEGSGASVSGPGVSITSTRRQTHTEWGGGLAVFRSFRPRDGTSSYVGAAVRLTQTHVTVRERFRGGPGRPRDANDSVSRYKANVAALVGVQHAIASRFAVFGEFGVGWSGGDARFVRGESTFDSQWGLVNAGVGFRWYLR